MEETIEERLKRIRIQSGLTQQQMADKLGITKSAVSKYEHGLRKIKYETIEEIAKALNCDISELLTPAEESKMIIDGLIEELDARQEARENRQTEGDYAVYLLNLLVERAHIIDVLTTTGVDIRFQTSEDVTIKQGIVTQTMATRSFAEKLEKLNDSFNRAFRESELLNPDKEGE